MRIRIEMAFGLLCGKWGILQRRIQMDLTNAGNLFMCCATLHNYVINERILHSNHDDDITAALDPRAGEENTDTTFVASDVQVSTIPGNSIMRDILVQRISDLALVRPQYNLQRNN
jgi:hypothetical protein